MELIFKRLQAKEAEIAQCLIAIETLQQQLKAKEENCKCTEKNQNQKNQNQSQKNDKKD
tara:strand:+ start:8656 stop:8832 length:177 start_codon:yes stop_codon:yes gene_type:complete